jgi:HEAT repeat protein
MHGTFTPIAASLACAVSLAAAVAAQQPRIANGTLTSQQAGTPFAASFRSLVSSQTDVVWMGYSVPVVESERVMCCFQSGTTWINGDVVMGDRSACCGFCRLEPSAEGTASPTPVQPAAGPIRLEGSDRMVVLFRIADRRVDRLRIFSEDCQLDAGGRPVRWLENVRAADSVALLESYAAADAADRRDRVAETAVSAIAMHGDPAADTALDRLVAPPQTESVRKKATFWLGNARGRHGLDTLKRVLRDDPSDEVRKSAVFGVSQSRESDAIPTLIQIAKTHDSARLRGEAIFWLGQKAGGKAAAAITDRIEQDPDTEVKKKAVFALSQLPRDEGVPLLIRVARTNTNPAVRKQAMFWLGQSKDPRAIDFFAEILAK